VYFRYGHKIDLAYANWHTEYKTGEGRSAYLQRTWDLQNDIFVTFQMQEMENRYLFLFSADSVLETRAAA
jgi:hypothetical protein